MPLVTWEEGVWDKNKPYTEMNERKRRGGNSPSVNQIIYFYWHPSILYFIIYSTPPFANASTHKHKFSFLHSSFREEVFLQVNKKLFWWWLPDIYHYAIISGFLGYSQEKQVLHNYYVTPKETSELKLPSHPSNFTKYHSQRWKLLPVVTISLIFQCYLFAFSVI